MNGLAGAVGDGLTLDLDGNWLQLQNGRLFVKADVAPEVLLKTSTPEQLIATGRTTLAARVERVERVGPGHLKINGLDFTPCDCNPLEPHWSIKATAADVHPGDQAWLWLPVIYVYGVPILPLPVLDVPLKPQKTGLLVTTPSHSAQNGWQVTQPVYFALASNWDLTATPGYTWGSSVAPTAGTTVLGVKGPSLDTEVRWAHSRDTKGDIELFLLDDLRTLRDPRSLAFYPAATTHPGAHPMCSTRSADSAGVSTAASCRASARVVRAPRPEPGLGRRDGEGHHDRRRPAGQPVSAHLGGGEPTDPGQPALPRGHRASGPRLGWILGVRERPLAGRAPGVGGQPSLASPSTRTRTRAPTFPPGASGFAGPRRCSSCPRCASTCPPVRSASTSTGG